MKNEDKSTVVTIGTGGSKGKNKGQSARSKLDAASLKRERRKATEEADRPPVPPPVSSGPIDKVIDLAFNASREKIREVTIIDRIQGKLFPIIDMIITGRNYILEVALFREDAEAYQAKYKRPRPVTPNLLDEFLFRTAQWQKSVAGKNLERITDIALAETERGIEESDIAGGKDAWKDET